MWDGIRDKVALLARRDPKHRAPSAASHRYQLKPVATLRDVEGIERRYGVVLPDEYRSYVLEVANGGAGPEHGVYALGHYRDGVDWHRWEEGAFAVSPAKAFAPTEPWNLPARYLAEGEEGEPSEEAVREAVAALANVGVTLRPPSGKVIGKNPFGGEPVVETWEVLVDAAAASKAMMDGTIPIATQGCNLGVSLVVSGSERGNVWFDWRADAKGIIPASAPGRSRLTFRDWYVAWLDGALARSGG